MLRSPVRVLKQLLLKQTSFYDNIEHLEEDKAVRDIFNSRDALEGVAARIEKRPPIFEGQ